MRVVPLVLLIGGLALLLLIRLPLDLGIFPHPTLRPPAPQAEGESTSPLAAAPDTGARAAAEHAAPAPRSPEAARELRLVFVLPAGAPPKERLTVRLFTASSPLVAGRPSGGPAAWSEAGRLEGILPTPGHRLHVPAGATSLRVTVSADHLLPQGPVERMGLPAAGPLEPARVVLRVGGQLHYRLVPPAHCPLDPMVIRGREVHLQHYPTRLALSPRGATPTLPVRIDDDLVVRVRGLSPDRTYDLFGRVAPFAPLKHLGATVSPGETVEVELPLQLGLSLSGWVLDHEENPLPDAELWVSYAGSRSSGGGAAKVGNQGMFRLSGITPDMTSITARHTGLLPAEVVRADLPAGHELHGIILTLWPTDSLAGTVRLPGGTPVAGVEVELTPAAGHAVLGRALTDTEGRFRFLDLEDRVYRVHCTVDPADDADLTQGSGRRQGQATARPGDQDVVLELVVG